MKKPPLLTPFIIFVALVVPLLAATGCDAGSPGTPTALADLVKTRINVRARAGAPAKHGRAALPPSVEVELDFEDVGAMDGSGRRCPVLRKDAGATVDGRAATFVERGGPVGQGRATIEYYLCRPIRFIAPVEAPQDHRIAIAVTDRTRTFEVGVEGLFDAQGAVLPTPADDRPAHVVVCAGGLLCSADPALSLALQFER